MPVEEFGNMREQIRPLDLDPTLPENLREELGKLPRTPYVPGVRREQNIVIMPLVGKILDETYIQRFGALLFPIARHLDTRDVALDFSEVKYLSGAALGKMITADKILKNRGKLLLGMLGMFGMRPDIKEVFTITRLNKLFPIEKDFPALLDAMEKARQKLMTTVQNTGGREETQP